MARQTWQELLGWATSDGAAIANTAAETAIFPGVTVPANYMSDGRALHMRASGKHSTTGTPNLTFKVTWGTVGSGTVLATTGTIVTGSGVTNNLWEVDLILQTRANGATGTILAIGRAGVVGATVPAILWCVGGTLTPAATTVDLTADTVLNLSATWGTASASNTLTGMIYELATLN